MDATSTLGNSNFTGGFLAMVLPVGIVLALYFPDRRMLIASCCALVLAGLLVSRSEGGYAAAVTGLLITGALLLKRPLARVALMLGAVAIVMSVIGVVVIGVVRPGVVPDTIELRGRWWRAAGSIALASPIVGKGPSTFALEHSLHRTPDDVAATAMSVEPDPHSVPLSLAAGAGILGPGGFAIAIFWLLRVGYRASPRSYVAVGLLGGVGAYIVQGLVSIDTVALRSTFWVIAGGLAAAAAVPTASSRPKHAAKPKKGARGAGSARKTSTQAPVRLGAATLPLIVVAVVLAAGWALRLVRADAHYQDALAAQGSFQETRSEYEAAVRARSEIAYQGSYGQFLGQIALQLAEQGGEAESQRLVQEAREAYAPVGAVRDVRWAVAHARSALAWARADIGSTEEVMALYERAVALDPQNLLLYAEAAEAADQLGDERRADLFRQRVAELQSAG